MAKFIQLSEHHPDSAFLEEHKRMHDVFAWRPKTTWLPPDDYVEEVHKAPEWPVPRLPTWFMSDGAGVDLYDAMHARSEPAVKAAAADFLLNRRVDFTLPGRGKSKAARKVWLKWAKKSGFKVKRLKLKKEKK